MKEVIVRPYRAQDRGQLRDIAAETAFMGEPCDIFSDAKELIADFLTLYYTDYEPQSAFVAESAGRVVGYLIGAQDAGIARKVFQSRIFGRLCLRAILKGVLFKKKDVIFLFSCLKSFLRGELTMPDFSREYPATLHINLKDGFRKLGTGGKLMAAYLAYLARHKIPGVHFASASAAGVSFFKKQGFSVLHVSQRSYFNYILHNNISVYVFGKKVAGKMKKTNRLH